MKILYKKLFILGMAILAVNCVQAQKRNKRNGDYVITAKGDTVPCVITIPFLGKDTYTSMDDTSQTLKPEEIREYYIRNKKEHYMSVFRPGETKPVFLKALEIGKMNLYEDPMPNVTGSYSGKWFISKGSDKIIELKGNKLSPGKTQKTEFETMIMDNKSVYDTYVSDKKYTYDEVRSIIHLYNTGEWQQGWPKTYPH